MNIFKGLFYGLCVGAVIALGLFAIAYALEFVNCLLCGCIGSQCIPYSCYGSNYIDPAYMCWTCERGPFGAFQGLLPIWSTRHFINTLIFCAIAGEIVGTVYGFAKQVQKLREDIWKKR